MKRWILVLVAAALRSSAPDAAEAQHKSLETA